MSDRENNSSDEEETSIEIEGEVKEKQENVFLTFDVAEETYGIAIYNVTEIIRVVKITPIPDIYESIKGVINLRGKIIPVMDIRTRMGIDDKEYDDRTCVIVINALFNDPNKGGDKGVDIGIVVDRVAEVIEIPREHMEPAPKVGEGQAQRFVRGIGKVGEKIRIIIDLDKLLFDFAGECKGKKSVDVLTQ
ncbi:MAG: chemotaxis protein CheW [Oligoflexia bacterium]|nr:chemotaxis protein CheW [Oligoflexia bacterium]